MRNIKLTIEYDGANYAGWQKQKNALTIQQAIEEAIEKVTSEKIAINGSSRTDTGVHAKAYAANFHTESSIPAERFREAINSKLPKDIVILKSEEVSEEFHARYSSKGKKYCYTVLNRIQPPALNRNYVYHYKGMLDIDKMQQASKYFIGTHDFAAFKNTGSSVKTSVRTITESEVVKCGDTVKYYVAGDGFLYNMVRIMVGTLLEVGSGKISPEDISRILSSKDRTEAGKSVPAAGLCLEEVYY